MFSHYCYFLAESVNQKLLYLKGHSEDEATELEYWNDTRKARDDMLKIEKLKVHEYMLRFKALRETLGQNLLFLYSINNYLHYNL